MPVGRAQAGPRGPQATLPRAVVPEARGRPGRPQNGGLWNARGPTPVPGPGGSPLGLEIWGL